MSSVDLLLEYIGPAPTLRAQILPQPDWNTLGQAGVAKLITGLAKISSESKWPSPSGPPKIFSPPMPQPDETPPRPAYRDSRKDETPLAEEAEMAKLANFLEAAGHGSMESGASRSAFSNTTKQTKRTTRNAQPSK